MGKADNLQMEKSELVQWIQSLKDARILHELMLVKKKNEVSATAPPREFGGGKHFFSYIADDFNEPLEDLKDYM